MKLPFLLALVRPHLGASSGPPSTERNGWTGESHRATKMVKGLEHFSWEKKLEGLGLLSLENRRLRRDLVSVHKHLKGWGNENATKLL